MIECFASAERSGPSPEVELATPADAEGIFDVQRRTWLETYPNEGAGVTREDIRVRLEGVRGELIPHKVDWFKRGIETMGETRAIYVARESGRIIGYVAPSIIEDRRRIGAVYVLPEAQGAGAGGKLLQKAIEWHGRREDIFLRVASYNAGAIGFYRRYGFAETGTSVKDDAAIQAGHKPIPEIEMVLKASSG